MYNQPYINNNPSGKISYAITNLSQKPGFMLVLIIAATLLLGLINSTFAAGFTLAAKVLYAISVIGTVI